MRRVKLKIIGADCPSCVYSITRRLESLKCINSMNIDLATGIADIEFDESRCQLKDIYDSIRDSGYDVYKEKLRLDLMGLSVEETPFFERQVLRLKGVLDVRISPSSEYALVSYNPLEVGSEDLLRELEKLGARPLHRIPSRAGFTESTLPQRRLASFAIGFSLVALSLVTMYGLLVEAKPVIEKAAPLAALLAVTLNYDIIARGFKSLIRLSPVMDSLIAVSSTSTLLAGLLAYAGVIPERGGVDTLMFFEASAGVMGFVGLGRYMEERLRRSALKSVEDYVSILGSRARVKTESGLIEKNVSQLAVGDLVEVREGEAIPVDGIVVDGSGYVDESAVTGEATPRLKKSDSKDPVLAGSFLVSGYIIVRATRVGEDTVIGQIVETVRQADAIKPRIARIADVALGYFTWLVIALAVVTLVYWTVSTRDVGLAVIMMASVLTIACPCALGIAIPLVLSLTVLKLSRSGVIVRRGDVFEKLRGSELVFLFDKTGTLTSGKLSLVRVHTTSPLDPSEILAYACSLESKSEHPISRAIIDECNRRNSSIRQVQNFASRPGEGVYGLVDGNIVAVGNTALMERLEVRITDDVAELIREIASQGRTPVLVAVNSSIVGVIELGDTIREEAPIVIGELKKRGYKTGVVSGDLRENVERVRENLGLDFSYGELKPERKADVVKRMKRKGYRVIFVGDGINDAPALAIADVGIAMGQGAEISKIAGDVVIANNNLRGVLLLLDYSRLAVRKMLQNLAWALIYNATLIPLAMGVLYESHGILITPHMAALAMILSDISIVLNSLTILRYSHT